MDLFEGANCVHRIVRTHKYRTQFFASNDAIAQYIGPCVYTSFMCPGVNQGFESKQG